MSEVNILSNYGANIYYIYTYRVTFFLFTYIGIVLAYLWGRRAEMYMYISTPPYILYKYITYLALKTMIVQNNIKHIYTIGLAAAAAAAAAA